MEARVLLSHVHPSTEYEPMTLTAVTHPASNIVDFSWTAVDGCSDYQLYGPAGLMYEGSDTSFHAAHIPAGTTPAIEEGEPVDNFWVYAQGDILGDGSTAVTTPAKIIFDSTRFSASGLASDWLTSPVYLKPDGANAQPYALTQDVTLDGDKILDYSATISDFEDKAAVTHPSLLVMDAESGWGVVDMIGDHPPPGGY